MSDDAAFTSSRITYRIDETTGQQRRQGHLMALLPLSKKDDATGERVLQEFRVYVELSAFLAYKHLQKRSSDVLPDLPKHLQGCDFDLTYRHHDTQFSPLQACREVLGYELPNLKQPEKKFTFQVSWPDPPTVNPYWASPTTADSTQTIHDYWSLPPENHTTNSHVNQNLSENGIPEAETGAVPAPETIWNNSSSQLDTKFNNLPPTDTYYVQFVQPGPTNNNTYWTTTTTTPPGSRTLQQQPQPEPQKPFAILGAARSAVSQAVGILSSAFELPQISSSSTASNLDELPFFSRTVPTNQGDAHSTIWYLSQTLRVYHVGVLHSEDSWGRRYEQDLQFYGNRYGVTVRSVAYTDTPEGYEEALLQLEQLQLRYLIGILLPSSWKPVVQKAYEKGLIGNSDHTWFIADLVELVGDEFALDRETEADIAVALHGTGVISVHVTPHPSFDRALAMVADDKELQQEFIASHSEPELLANFTFSPNPGMSLFQYLTYDAVVALGITACATPGLFTGKEFYDQLVQVDFQGVSGRVALNHTTGTRLGESLQYQIVNMVLNDYLQPTNAPFSEAITFSANVSSLIELAPQSQNGTILAPQVHSVKPFVYFNNSTIPPLSLPPLEENMNLIPDAVLYFGLSLALVVMLLSAAIAVWVLRNQRRYVVRASQPFFMVQLCAGTFLLAATIIPMGWQEPKSGLDAACQSTPWLFTTGFAVSVSALFGKARRINQLIGNGFRRCRVRPQDVMKPFFLLMFVNVVLLTAWSASPWRISWHRITVEDNVDRFGRTIESYGVCRANSNWHFLLSTPLVCANVLFLGMATWQSYRARGLPSELSESSYLAVSMVGLTETFCLGFTIVFAVMSNPTAFYVFASVMICVGCMSILGPMFGPKFVLRNMKEPRGQMAVAVVTGKASRVSGLHSDVLDPPSATGSGGRMQISSRWNLSKSGSVNSYSSGFKSSGVLSTSSNTYQPNQRPSLEDPGPFGSRDNRSSATDQIIKPHPLTTHDEEEAGSSSFNVL